MSQVIEQDRPVRFQVGNAVLSVQCQVDGWAQYASARLARYPACSGGGVAVTVRADSGLGDAAGPLEAVVPVFNADGCRLEGPGYSGYVSLNRRTAELALSPTVHVLGNIDYFLRVCCALTIFENSCILFHAAGVVRNGSGFALFGPSGSGKTTAARFSVRWDILNDDLVVLVPTASGWELRGTPFSRWHVVSGVQAAPLRVLLRLVQDREVGVADLLAGQALGELTANSPLLCADPLRLGALFERWQQVVQQVPVRALHFKQDQSFWECVDAHFG